MILEFYICSHWKAEIPKTAHSVEKHKKFL